MAFVKEESFTLTGLSPLSTVLVLVRARNDHGLSPPSPVSKPMATLAKIPTENEADDKQLIRNPALVRIKLTQKILELREANAVGSRKVKLLWEVRNILYLYSI